MPLHDSMPSFLNFRRVLYLLEFKNKVSQCFAGNQRCPGVWNSFPFLPWVISMHPRTQIWFSTNLYALEHVHVVQIWIMYINALKTQLMHKNVQTNPEKSQKFTQHSCCSLLTQEKNFQAIRGNGYRFVPKEARSLPKTIMLLVRSSGLWEAYTQTCPKWKKNVPLHVDAAPWWHAKFHEFQTSFGFTRI